MYSIMGMPVIESVHMTIGPFEDWSKVRSPSRAKRRLKLGHKQNINIYHSPNPDVMQMANGTFVGHPATIAKLRNKLKETR